ncbi:hypothetical protein M3221_21515 [Domibacillus indicus]|uniref:hypothetical protein n=1 Tax=Domibacillus indicus TaxID=1437523 RepID=UPI00203CD569|nr:hypothetical protein [Domibacillus indicus]MCM3790924.1 hypothetical protein [Domibacillus indicus]
MYSVSGIQVLAEGSLKEKRIELEEHNETYCQTVSFKDREGEHVGDLDIYFVVKGFGKEEGSEEIDVHFTVPFFSAYGPEGERFMEEAEAMQFIFVHFASEVQDVVDEVLDTLYERYENEEKDRF